jgi:drug/metabolite transporter (DMT)-like permease
MTEWLWIVFTLIAAAAQTVRNAMQRELTSTLGTVGATQVRFLFGFPFGLIFLAGVLIASGEPLPLPGPTYFLWIALGAAAQTVATVLMLAAMNDRSFVVIYAYIKTEPVQVALFGLILLGDVVTLPMAMAILIATCGVVVMALRPGASAGGLRPTLLGLAAGAMFGLSAIGFRGAILQLGHPNYVVAATFTAALGLSLAAQSAGADRDPSRLEAVAVRRLHRGAGLAVLVPRLRARHRRQRAHARFSGGAVRPRHFAFYFQATDDTARSGGHRVDRCRSRAADLGLLVSIVWQHRQRMEFDALFRQCLGFIRRRLAVD